MNHRSITPGHFSRPNGRGHRSQRASGPAAPRQPQPKEQRALQEPRARGMRASGTLRDSSALRALFALAFVLLLGLGPAAAQSAFALSADEIIERMEANQTHPTSYIEGEMVITDRFGDRVSTFIAHTEGAERFLLEFTSRDEEGQRVLRRNDDLYLYYPDARETIRLTGSALRDSLLGSDISYEDMTGGRGLADDYDFTLRGEERVNGRPTYKIELTARSTNVAYPKQIYWVDSEDFVLRKSEQYARAGRKLKVTEVLETKEQGEYKFPSRIRITDQTRRSSGTEMVLNKVEIDINLPRGIFSLEELTW